MDIQEFKDFAGASIEYIADYCENIRNVSTKCCTWLSKQSTTQTSSQKRRALEFLDGRHRQNNSSGINTMAFSILPCLLSNRTVLSCHRRRTLYGRHRRCCHGLGLLRYVIKERKFLKEFLFQKSSPAVVELEVRVMDWLAKILGLPEEFLNCSEGPGGGLIQSAASESTLVGILSAKYKKIQQLKTEGTPFLDWEVEGRLVAYTSNESNSSVEKSGLITSVKMRLLPTDSKGSLRGNVLHEAIRNDKEHGLIPFCVVASLGTTGTCAMDNLEEIGQICTDEKMWLHIDAAYAGTALACPEYRYLLKGIEYVDSFNFNPHKWMLVNGDCSAMWFRNCKFVEEAFKAKATLKVPVFEPELEHRQIPDVRRFRALKLWFVIRIYGVQGIQNHVRHQIGLATYLEELVKADKRFEVVISTLGVVCFQLLKEDSVTHAILERIAKRKNIYIMPYYYKGQLLFRFVVCSRFTQKEDIDKSWSEILSQTNEVLKDLKDESIKCKEIDGMIETSPV
ncbi:aromatic-L-amino-acid decarboxylase-like isoform X1 [Euwallacea fornicatus]|uniref:aromatic-L-amino-acid decarboxylase-like isoform X1 n=1 Tax=Euwallacea fornicatus TaxID=995702 RepID=UPI00338DF887